MDLLGRVAIVTGSSRGIGAGIALGLAQSGADLVITYQTNKAQAEAIGESIRKLGRKALASKAGNYLTGQTINANGGMFFGG